MQLHGTITRKYQFEPASGGVELVGALALAGAPGFADAEVSITRTTRVMRAGPATPLTFAELREGDRVMVLLASPVQETYPVRGVAAEVIIVA